MNRRPYLMAVGVVAVLAFATSACGDDDESAGSDRSSSTDAASTTAPGATAGDLVGLFEIDAGACAAAGEVSGSYFRMVQSGGTLDAGPFVANADSSCADSTYSALAPGDRGLITGAFQAQPDPPFDGGQNGVASDITAPTKFFAVDFAVSSNPKDPQTGLDVSAPTITSDGSGNLTGDLRALSVAWNGQQFNQGSPKPDDSHPGNTVDLTGTYDSETGAYVLDWASQIVGGPFDGFTGVWHLEGTFEAT